MSLFQLPLYDVLFPHIFCYLDIWEIWELRTVCKGLCHICWQYYKNACKSLRINATGIPLDVSLTHVTLVKRLKVLYIKAEKLLRVCTRLETFEIDFSQWMFSDWDNIQLSSLLVLVAKGPSKITRLHLAGFTVMANAYDMFSKTPSDKFNQLCELTLHNLGYSLRPFSQRLALRSTTAFFLQETNHDRLKKLHLQNVYITQDCLLRVAHNNPHLEYLCVGFCYPTATFTYNCLTEVFRLCPGLKTVNVRRINCVNDRTLSVLAEYCKQLKHLFIEGCCVSDKALQVLASQEVTLDVEVKQSSVHRVLGQI